MTRRVALLIVGCLSASLCAVPGGHIARAARVNADDSVSDSSNVSTSATPQKAKVVKYITTNDPVFFITIDDGTRVSPELARLLDERKIPVTSFVLPEFLSTSKLASRKWFLARKRMTFENHTNVHAHLTLMTLAQQKREICGASRLVEARTGQVPMFLRPPRGSWNENTRIATAACGMKYLVMWNAESKKDGLKTWGTRPLTRGDIVLFHYVSTLPQQLENVLRLAKARGLRPALLRDYLK